MTTSLIIGQTVSLAVRCSDEAQQQPSLYRPGDIIPAIAEVHKHRPFEVLSLHGSLVGETRVWSHPTGREDLYQTMIHTHLNQLTGFSYALPSIENSSGGTATLVPIAFVLPELAPAASGSKDINSNSNLLPPPPSCESGSLYLDPWRRSYMQPLIEYHLQVTLRFRLPGETAIRSITAKHKIKITAALHVDPPMYSRSAIEVKPVTAYSEVRRSRFAKPFARVQVEMKEPVPVIGCRTGGQTGGQATGQLGLTWETSSAAYDEFEIGKRPARIVYQLQARTRYATRGILPSGEENSDEREKPHQYTESTHLGTFEVRAADRNTVTLTVGEDKGRSHSGTIPIPIRVGADTIPTFSHHLASRDYALLVKVKIQGLQHDPLLLRVPVQICESTARNSNENPGTKFSYGDTLTSEILPRYEDHRYSLRL